MRQTEGEDTLGKKKRQHPPICGTTYSENEEGAPLPDINTQAERDCRRENVATAAAADADTQQTDFVASRYNLICVCGCFLIFLYLSSFTVIHFFHLSFWVLIILSLVGLAAVFSFSSLSLPLFRSCCFPFTYCSSSSSSLLSFFFF